MRESKRSWYWLGVCLGLIALGLVAYANIIGSFFVADDFALVLAVRERGPLGTWTQVEGGFFRPLIALSVYLDYQLWGLSPVGYHLTNLVAHGLNAFLVALVAAQLLRLETALEPWQARRTALASGLLFLLMPNHTEAVSWIAGRTDVFATLFCLLSFWLYLRHKSGAGGRYLLGAAAAYLLALLAKESVFTFPLVVLLYELYARWRANRSRLFAALSPFSLFLAAFGAYSALRYQLTSSLGGSFLKDRVLFDLNPVRPIKNVGLLLLKPFLPQLRLDPAGVGRAREQVYGNALLIAGALALFVLALLYVGVRQRHALAPLLGRLRRLPAVTLVLLAMAVIALLPAINLGISFIDSQGERFMYLPSAYYAIVLGLAIFYLGSFQRRAIVASALVCGYFAVALFLVNADWRKAGRISQDIVTELVSISRTSERLFILNLPRGLHGAYISGNVQDALDLFGDYPAERVFALAYHPIYAPDDVVLATQSGDVYALEIVNRRAAMRGPPAEMAEYDILGFTGQGYSVRLNGRWPGDAVVAYSAGDVAVVVE